MKNLSFYLTILFSLSLASSQPYLQNSLSGTQEGEDFGYAVSSNGNGQRSIVGSPDFNVQSFYDDIGEQWFYHDKAGKATIYSSNTPIHTIEGTQFNENVGKYVAMNKSNSSYAVNIGMNNFRVFNLSNDQMGNDFSDFSPVGRTPIALAGDLVAYTTTSGAKVQKFDAQTNTWNQFGDLINAGNLSISGNASRIVIGNGGTARVVEYNESTSTWDLVGSAIDGGTDDSDDSFGGAVSINWAGDRIIAGNDGLGEPSFGNIPGYARLYEFSGSNWSQIGNDITSSGNGDGNGHSVAVDSIGATVVVGSIQNTLNQFSGFVRMFNTNSGSLSQYGSMVTGLQGEQFGFSVDISNKATNIILGAPNTLNSYEGNGKVYKYTADVRITAIPDPAFEQLLIDLEFDSGEINGSVLTSEIEGITILDFLNPNSQTLAPITDLTGLQDFTALVDFIIDGCLIDTLDISSNHNIQFLSAYNARQLMHVKFSTSADYCEVMFEGTPMEQIDLRGLTIPGSAIYGTSICEGPYIMATATPDEEGNMIGGNLQCILMDPDEVDFGNEAIANELWGVPQGVYADETCIILPPTLITDANFEQALIDLELDDAIDGQVATRNINDLETLVVSMRSITDLTGIEGFTSLQFLDVHENDLTTVNLSANASLSTLYIYDNQLSSIDVSANTNLVDLRVHMNQLTSLDVSLNTGLNVLVTGENPLTALNVSSNVNLTHLWAFENGLNNIDLSANTSLTELILYSNDLTTLDVSANTELQVLNCNENNLMSLDVSANVALVNLECNNNQLTSLNLISNVMMYQLNCSENQELECILVSDVMSVQNNWVTVISPWMQFNDVSCPVAPVLTDIAALTMDEDSELKVELTATDADGGPLFFDVNVNYPQPNELSAYVVHYEAGFDTLFIQSHNNWFGDAELEVYVNDDTGKEDMQIVALTVNSVDDEPVFEGEIQDVYVEEDFNSAAFGWNVNLDDVFFDIDGELVYSVSLEDETVITAQLEGSVLSLHPVENANGQTTMNVTASNPTRASVTESVMITVFAVNDAPVVVPPTQGIVFDEDQSSQLLSMAQLMTDGYIMDIDNSLDELNFELHANSEALHIEWDGNPNSNPMLMADPNFYGEGSVSLCVNDGEFESCVENSVTVNAVNDAPMFVSNLEAAVGLGLEFNIQLEAEDIDSDNLVISLASGGTFPAWLQLTDNALHGTPTELGPFPLELELSDGALTVTGTFNLHVENFVPQILEITDVPNDQGGRVYLAFNGSFLDNGEETGQSYSVFRYDTYADTSGWVGVQSIDAVGQPSYVYEVTTVMDSTVGGPGLTNFMVIASMNNGIFPSVPMMGYSVDNILPGVPGGVMATAMDDNIHLSWDLSADDDFQYFIVEKSMDAGFATFETMETIDTFYVDVDYVSNENNYYRLAAVDHAGNQSGYTEVVEAAVLSIDVNAVPEVFAIHQNYPNPFNPTTKINYDLPEDALVTINIYDVMGRSISTLISSPQSAGYRSIQWNATNSYGEPVSAGMYIYTIQAGEFRATKKMVLLK